MKRARVAVIGAGVSGLAAAHRLSELEALHDGRTEIVLFESSSRAGGVVETVRRGGFVFEKGPDSLLSQKPWALDLARRLGLEDQIVGTSRSHARSFVVRGRRLHPIPKGFYLVAPSQPLPFLASGLFSAAGKLRMMGELFVPPRRSRGDESVAQFVRRRFGREALERAGQPLLAGIYAADPERLSLLATLPHLSHLESKHGSVVRGLWAEAARPGSSFRQAAGPRYSLFTSFRGGLGALTDALERRLGDGAIRRRSSVRSVERARGLWRVLLEDGSAHEADSVCLAVPSHVAARILRADSPDLSRELEGLGFGSVATLNLVYRVSDVPHPLDGFGFVVPATEARTTMACTFAHRKFEGRAPEGLAVLRAFLGGAYGEQHLEKDDERLLGEVRRDLEELLGIRAAPVESMLERYPRAMAQYAVGHAEWTRRVESACPEGLYLTGSSYGGVGIPDCVRHAEACAEKMHAALLAKFRVPEHP